ncbi:MAG: LacI family DNA-binding transcriptional regulator, partial [Lachnospiraceae bacterium]|nr:LacI family DNA-binding transcriptional regulator [Lachnospiraceae bacterium]
MGVTLQQIAEAAGVSRGTVDRALNNRGRINPVVAEKIKNIAKEMGYQPNRAGRALALSKQGIRIGVIIQSMETPFIKKLLEGVEEAREEIRMFGVETEIRTFEGQSAGRTLSEMDNLKEAGCNGLIFMGTDDERVIEKINAFADENIPVITFNSDAENSKRVCYIGQNSRQSGKAAGGLMAQILPESRGVAVLSGYPLNHSHSNRVKGFLREMTSCREDADILDVRYIYDSEERAEQIAEELMKDCPNLGGFYVAAAGAPGVCRAVEKAGKRGKIKIISNDLTDSNIEQLKKGMIHFLIGQDAHVQGHEPVTRMFSLLVDGVRPDTEKLHTDIVIKTKYNI